MPNRAVPRTKTRRIQNGGLQIMSRAADGVRESHLLRQACRNGRCERAPRPMRILGFNPRQRDGLDTVLMHEKICQLVRRAMPAFDERGLGPHRQQGAAGGDEIIRNAHRQAGEFLGFRLIWRNDRGARDEMGFQRQNRVIGQ